MPPVPALPDDLSACQALLRQALAEKASLEDHAFSLERENAALQQARDEQERVLDATAAAYEDLRQERDELREELARLRRWVFGRRRERFAEADGQGHLFALPELPESEPPPWAIPKEDAPLPRRRRTLRRTRWEHLPERRIEHDVPGEEKTCECCGREKTRIGQDERRVIQYRPAVLEVELHVLPKYACSCCRDGVVSPPPPERVLPRSIAGPGLIAEILVNKFGDHLPLYRQEDIFTRSGVHFPRSTLCDWVKGAAELFRPLYDLQKQRVLTSPSLWTDDTPIRLLDPKAPGGSRQARVWCYLGDESQPYAVYDFTPDWSRAGPAAFLAGYAGCLHADAYSGYEGIVLMSEAAIVKVACGAHIRRKFVDAKANAPREAAQMLEWFRQLYDLEDRAREWTPEARCALRQAEAVPVLARMNAFLDELSHRVLPKSALGQAVTYARNQWEAFCRYVEDGRRTIDNNACERTLRAQAIGRRNWLFLGHENAGPRAAVLFTVLAGAKRHRLEPWAYLSDALLQLAAETDDLDRLLPDRWAAAHPEHVLTHRLEESRQKRARQKTTRATRRRSRP